MPTTGSGNPMLHLATQDGLLARLARLRCPTLLCGDFNSPLAERADGTVVPFAPRRDGRRYAAEAKLMGLTNARGMVDLFRACHGYGIDAASWHWKNRGRTGRYRLRPHCFATAEFRVRSCDYMHEWRTARLSDHSAIYADAVLAQRP